MAAIIVTSVISILCTFVLAGESQRNKLLRISQRRRELLSQIERIRRDASQERMSRSIKLAELHQELFMLDYDDPRTKLGATLAMTGVTDEEIIDILFDMVVSRKPKADEAKLCKKHLEKNRDKHKGAVHDIVWALCNSREFVVLIGK